MIQKSYLEELNNIVTAIQKFQPPTVDLSQISMLNSQVSELIARISKYSINFNIPLIYSALNSIDTPDLERALDISRQITNFTNNFKVVTDKYNTQLVKIFENLDFMTRRIALDYSAISSAANSLFESGIFHELIEKVEFDRRAIDAFYEAGWPISPSMPKYIIERVVELHQIGKVQHASQVIIGYYRKNNWGNLIKTVHNWTNHSLYKSRMGIIFDALDAHCQGKYSLSVPALLPQIEGILIEYIRANNLAARLGKIKMVYETAIGEIDDHSLTTWTIAGTLLFCLQNNTYVSSDFELELKKSITRRRVSRHTVLHGISPGYNRPIHSLKTFVILDALTILDSD
jgi:hypothetical protein